MASAIRYAGTRDVVAAAERCRDRFADATAPYAVAQLAALELDLDEDFCLGLADRFERLPRLLYDGRLAARYARLKEENRLLYEAIADAGIAVEPWLRPVQPYRDATEMALGVMATGTLYVFLTRDGHGPGASAGFHPLREPAGVAVRGVQLCHNDLLRATHDVFGHVMFGHGFGLAGELKAAYCHMALFSPAAQPVLLTEQVAQICWFFLGPHLRDATGRVRKPGDSGYVEPSRRPYPKQKVFPLEPSALARFRRMFRAAA